MNPTGPELLTAAEVAALLRVSVASVNRWARDGDIAVVRLPGGKINRFRRADVDALLAVSEATA